MMRFLLISSFFLFISGCAVNKKQPTNHAKPHSFLTKSHKGLIYKSSFNYKEHHFSGIVVIIPEKKDIRVQFLTELGPAIMDFRLNSEKMEIIKLMGEFKKDVYLTQLEYDLRLLLMANLFQGGEIKYKMKRNKLLKYKIKGKKSNMIFVHEKNNSIVKAQRNGIGLDKVTVNYYYADNSEIPKTIILDHKMISMNLKLSLIK